jgi:hypothetical protein
MSKQKNTQRMHVSGVWPEAGPSKFNMSTICGIEALISSWNAAVRSDWVKHPTQHPFTTYSVLPVWPPEERTPEFDFFNSSTTCETDVFVECSCAERVRHPTQYPFTTYAVEPASLASAFPAEHRTSESEFFNISGIGGTPGLISSWNAAVQSE